MNTQQVTCTVCRDNPLFYPVGENVFDRNCGNCYRRRTYSATEVQAIMTSRREGLRLTSVEENRKEDHVDRLRQMGDTQREVLRQVTVGAEIQKQINDNVAAIRTSIDGRTNSAGQPSVDPTDREAGLSSLVKSLNLTALVDGNKERNQMLGDMCQRLDRVGDRVEASGQLVADGVQKNGQEISSEIKGLREEIVHLRDDLKQMVNLMAASFGQTFSEATFTFFETQFPRLLKDSFAGSQSMARREQDVGGTRHVLSANSSDAENDGDNSEGSSNDKALVTDGPLFEGPSGPFKFKRRNTYNKEDENPVIVAEDEDTFQAAEPQEKPVPIKRATPVPVSVHSAPEPTLPKYVEENRERPLEGATAAEPGARDQRLVQMWFIREEVQKLENQVHEVFCFDGTHEEKEHRYLRETLTQALNKLDAIEVNGNEQVRKERKALVEMVQDTLDLLELKAKNSSKI